MLNTRQVSPLDSDIFFWKLPDLDFPFKIKHSALDIKHETKSHTLDVIPHPRVFKVCVRVFVFFVFSWFSSFSSFLCFSLVCVILVIIKVKDAARIDTAFAKVFVSNSLCYCEFLVSLPGGWQEAMDNHFGNLEGGIERSASTERPLSTSRRHFVFGIERSASTERSLPGRNSMVLGEFGGPRNL